MPEKVSTYTDIPETNPLMELEIMKVPLTHSYNFTLIKPSLDSGIWFGKFMREIVNALHPDISSSSYAQNL